MVLKIRLFVVLRAGCGGKGQNLSRPTRELKTWESPQRDFMGNKCLVTLQEMCSSRAGNSC